MGDKINKKYTYKPLKSLKEEEIVKGILSCDTSILSRAITLLESSRKNDQDVIYNALKSTPTPKKTAFKIGITGSPGVGKSTFIEAFGRYVGNKNFKIAILKALWKVILSDNKSDIYENSLMRRICGLLYISDKLSGEIKLDILKRKKI